MASRTSLSLATKSLKTLNRAYYWTGMRPRAIKCLHPSSMMYALRRQRRQGVAAHREGLKIRSENKLLREKQMVDILQLLKERQHNFTPTIAMILDLANPGIEWWL